MRGDNLAEYGEAEAVELAFRRVEDLPDIELFEVPRLVTLEVNPDQALRQRSDSYIDGLLTAACLVDGISDDGVNQRRQLA